MDEGGLSWVGFRVEVGSARVELSGSGTSGAIVQVVAENQEVEVH